MAAIAAVSVFIDTPTCIVPRNCAARILTEGSGSALASQKALGSLSAWESAWESG